MPPSYDSLNSSLEEPENNGSSAVIDAQNGTTVTQVPVAKPLITRRGSLFRLNKLAFAITTGVLVFVVLAGLGTLLLTSHSQPVKSLSNQAANYTDTSLKLKNAPNSQALQLGNVSTLQINGQLDVSEGLVLAPTSAPSSAVAGQIYYSDSSNQPYYYNGQQFVSLGSQSTNYSGGSGITLNGTTIVNSGIVAITGTPNQITVSQSGGSVGLGLPQDIDQSASPTFASIKVSSVTSNSSDSGLSIGSLSQALSLQGSATTISDSDNGHTTQIAFDTPTQNNVLTIPDVSGEVCTSSNNCQSEIEGDYIDLQQTTPGTPQLGNFNISGAAIVGTLSAATGTFTGNVTASSFTGDGTNVTNVDASELGGQLPSYYLNASNINTGTLADAQLSPDVALTDQNNDFTAVNNFNNVDNSFTGNGSNLDDLNASVITNGTLSDSRLNPDVTLAGSQFNGANELIELDSTGVIPTLSGINLTNLDATNVASGTLSDARLSTDVTLQGNSFNGANDLVQLDMDGDLPAISGANLTDLNGTSINSGEVGVNYGGTGADDAADARTNLQAAESGVNDDITSLLDLTAITSSNGLTIGSTTQNLTLQGAITTLSSTSGNYTSTLGFVSPSANETILVPDASGTICLSTGNCAAIGSGYANQALSNLSDVAINADLLPATANTINLGSSSFPFKSLSLSDGGTHSYTISGSTADTNKNITLPTFTGSTATFCLSTGNCTGSTGGVGTGGGTANTIPLFDTSNSIGNSIITEDSGATTVTIGGQLSATGNVTFADQLAANGGIVTNGSTINTGTGVITGDGSGLINLDASDLTTGTVSDTRLSADVTLQGNTFNGDSELLQLTSMGVLPVVSGVNVTNLDATNLTSGTVADNRLSSNVALLDQSNQVFSGTNIFQPATGDDSIDFFRVQNAAGSNTVLDADTTDGRIGVDTATPGYALDVVGVVNSSVGFDIDGVPLCGTSGCVAATGNAAYIQNGTATQQANLNVQSSSGAAVAGVFQGANSQTADVLDVRNATGTNLLSISPGGTTTVTGNFGVSGASVLSGSLTANGTTTLEDSTNSSTAFQVQNALGVSVLNVATTTLVTPTAPTLTSASTGGTLAAGTYYYELAAINANGTTLAVASSPTNVTTTGSTSTNTLSWTTVSGATGYMVYRSINAGVSWSQTEVSSTTTSIIDSGSSYTWTSTNLPTINTANGNLNVNGAIEEAGLVVVNSNANSNNIGVGKNALNMAASGGANSALGGNSLQADTSGGNNVAIGYNSLYGDTSGGSNTAVGYASEQDQTTSGDNTALGAFSLSSNYSSSYLTSVGYNSLKSDTGASNTALGYDAGVTNTSANATTSGADNTYIGTNSGDSSALQPSNSTALGYDSIVSASNVVALGCTSGINSCTATTTVGIGTAGFAPNLLSVGDQTYGTYGTVGTSTTISQTTTAITGTGTTFTSGMTGGTIYYSDGTTATVTYVSATSLTSSVSKTVTAGSTYTIVYGGFNVTSTGTALLQPSTDSANVFTVNSASGTQLINVNSSTSIVVVGSSTAGTCFNSTGAVLIGGNPTSCSSAAKLTVSTSGTGEVVNVSGTNNILQLENNATNVLTVGSTGAATFENSTNSTTAFQIQNSSASELLQADTSNMAIGIAGASTTAGYALNVTGTINASNQIYVNGQAVCTVSSGCGGAGSGYYINNATTLQTANFNIQSASASSVTAAIEGAVGQTADLLDLDSNAGTVQDSFGSTGNETISPTSDSNNVLQIQDAAGVSVLNVATNTVYSPSAPTLTSASTGGTQPAGTYYYELAALSTNGTTTAVASSPSSVTTTGSTSVNTLTWSTVTGATGYMVYRSINGGTTWFTTEVPSGTTSITDNGSTYNWSSSAYLPTINTASSYLNINGPLEEGGIAVLNSNNSLYNLAVGRYALNSTTSGSFNTALGASSLQANTSGVENTATGYAALNVNTTGYQNVAYGYDSLVSSTTANQNTALGTLSLAADLTGAYNTAVGYNSLRSVNSGGGNVALGFDAGYTNVSANATTTGSKNTFLGSYSGSGSSSQISYSTAVGYNSVVSEGNALVLGCTSGVNSCSQNTDVGIGTASPQATLNLVGNTILSAIATPSAPSVANVGTAGSTSYSYAVSACNANTGCTLVSTATTTTTGNATLSATNYNTINWTAVAGASTYRIYRTASSGSPSTTGLIGTVSGNATLTLGDTGIAATTAAPTQDTSGQLTVSGNTLFENLNNSTTAFQVQNSSASTLIDADTTDGVVGIGGLPSAVGNTLQVSGSLSVGTSLPVTISSVGVLTANNSIYALNNLYVNGNISSNAGTGSYITLGGTNNPVLVNTRNATTIGLAVKGYASQTADLLDIDNSTSTIQDSFGATGNLLVQPSTNSTTAFAVQNSAGTGNELVVDTVNGKVGIDETPTSSGSSLQVAGSISSNANVNASLAFQENTNSLNAGNIVHGTTATSAGVNNYDVVIMNTGGEVSDTTTARDTRVYGVSASTVGAFGYANVVTSGDWEVNATTAAVNVGDQLVASSVSGEAMTDNNAITGIIGIALSSKAAGSAGVVDVAVNISRGEATEDFQPTTDSTTAFQVQNAAGTSTIFNVDTTNDAVTIGGQSGSGWNTAGAALYVGDNTTTGRSIDAAGTINASGADYAEWIPWTGNKPSEGTVITYNDSNMVVSSSTTAAFIGNDDTDEANEILVTFDGQVNVDVTGPVSVGDVLVPAGNGLAKAISSSDATLADYENKIGIAWAANSGSGEHQVLAAIGTSGSAANMSSYLQNGDNATLNGLTVNGSANFDNVNVSGETSINDLSVQSIEVASNITVGGTLTVTGLTTVTNIQINGHVVTSNAGGDVTTSTVQAAAGTNATCNVTGDDTSGQVTITTGTDGWTNGSQCLITFASGYSSSSHPVISPTGNTNDLSVGATVTPGTSSFTVNFLNADTAQHTYTFDYFNAQ